MYINTWRKVQRSMSISTTRIICDAVSRYLGMVGRYLPGLRLPKNKGGKDRSSSTGPTKDKYLPFVQGGLPICDLASGT